MWLIVGPARNYGARGYRNRSIKRGCKANGFFAAKASLARSAGSYGLSANSGMQVTSAGTALAGMGRPKR
jgi:hypothetical protein